MNEGSIALKHLLAIFALQRRIWQRVDGFSPTAF